MALFALAGALALAEGKLAALRRPHRLWLLALAGAFLVLLAMGWLRGYRMWVYYAKDLIWVPLLGGLLLAGSRRTWRVLDPLLAAHLWIGIAVHLWVFLTWPTPVTRADAWATPYLVVGLLYPWPYFLLTLDRGGAWRRVTAYAGTAVFLASQLAFLKRNSVGMVVVVAAAALTLRFLAARREGGVRAGLRAAGSVALGLAVASPLAVLALGYGAEYGAFLGDFADRVEPFVASPAPGAGGDAGAGSAPPPSDGGGDDGGSPTTDPAPDPGRGHPASGTIAELERSRYAEVTFWFARASWSDVVFGRGFGSYFGEDEPTPEPDSRGLTGQMHVGWANVVFKGGLWLLVLWYAGFALALREAWRRREDPRTHLAIGLLAFYLVSQVTAIAWSSWPTFALVLLAYGQVASRSAGEEPAPPARAHAAAAVPGNEA